MENTQGAASGHGNGVVYGVVALAGGVPVRVTVAFPAPLDADVWARQQRGCDSYHVTPVGFVDGQVPPA